MRVEAKYDQQVQVWVAKNDKLDKGNKHKEDKNNKGGAKTGPDAVTSNAQSDQIPTTFAWVLRPM